MNVRSRNYVPLMDIKVISSDLGQLFAFSLGGSYSDTRCGSSLHSDKALDYCRFVVLGSDGKEKGRYFVVGNSYDQDTKFSPVEHDWFANNTKFVLSAADFTAGDVVRVEFRRPDHLTDYMVVQAQMTVWVFLTHHTASTTFLNYPEACALLRHGR